MNWKSYRQQSRDIQWGTNGDSLSIEQVNCGSLLRIADATELMAKRYEELIQKAEFEERRANRYASRLETEQRRTAALRGVIGRMKRQRSATKI